MRAKPRSRAGKRRVGIFIADERRKGDMPQLRGAGNSGFRLRVLRSGDPRMHHVRPGPSGRPVRNLCSGDPRMRLVRGSPSRTGLPHLRSTVLHLL